MREREREKKREGRRVLKTNFFSMERRERADGRERTGERGRERVDGRVRQARRGERERGMKFGRQD